MNAPVVVAALPSIALTEGKHLPDVAAVYVVLAGETLLYYDGCGAS